MKFLPPGFGLHAFNCPHCTAFAHQVWHNLSYSLGNGGNAYVPNFRASTCSHCGEFAFWIDEKLIYPDNSTVSEPNEDLGEDIKTDYLEAASILNKSPRGAAALLRLVIQKLCIQLGEKGKDLNEDIGNLMKKGLNPQIQQSLDFVRVIGNEAVHPGSIDLKDDIDTASNLFSLVNLIAEAMITSPKEAKKLYDSLPKKKKEAIEKRDIVKE